jgi:hypothetical protein
MKNFAAITFSSLFNPLLPSTLAMTDYSTGSFHSNPSNTSFQGSGGTRFKKFPRYFKKSPMLPFIVIVIIVFVIAIIGITSVIRKSTTNVTPTSASGTTQQQVAVAKPLATETLNKTFQFPLKDSSGKTVSNISYQIQSAEFDNQIIVKGQEATAVAGKVFLVVNLQITNSYDKAVELNTRDYIRLIVNGNSSQKLAASIHNDPVDIEPISTTFTRIGFPINANSQSLALEVGQIDGPKQTIQLNLK